MARVLCVEDEDDLRADIVEELVDAGHQVFPAANGEDGLRAITEFCPDLIISDCLMPKMTGIELFRALHNRFPQFADTPFLFLSAHAEKSHVEEGLELGADAYLTKPVDFDQLIAVVNTLLSNRAEDAGGSGGFSPGRLGADK